MTDKQKIKIKYVSWDDMNEKQRLQSQYYACIAKERMEKCKKNKMNE